MKGAGSKQGRRQIKRKAGREKGREEFRKEKGTKIRKEYKMQQKCGRKAKKQ